MQGNITLRCQVLVFSLLSASSKSQMLKINPVPKETKRFCFVTWFFSALAFMPHNDSSIFALQFSSLNHFVITRSPLDSHAVTDNFKSFSLTIVQLYFPNPLNFGFLTSTISL